MYGRRLNSHWMRGVRWCFVWDQENRDNERNNLLYVTKYIKKLKEKHSTDRVLILDFEFITYELVKKIKES